MLGNNLKYNNEMMAETIAKPEQRLAPLGIIQQHTGLAICVSQSQKEAKTYGHTILLRRLRALFLLTRSIGKIVPSERKQSKCVHCGQNHCQPSGMLCCKKIQTLRNQRQNRENLLRPPLRNNTNNNKQMQKVASSMKYSEVVKK